MENDVGLVLSNSIRHTPATADDVRKETANGSVLRRAVKFVKSKCLKSLPEIEPLDVNRLRSSLSVVDSCLMLTDRVMIPSTSIATIPFQSPGNKLHEINRERIYLLDGHVQGHRKLFFIDATSVVKRLSILLDKNQFLGPKQKPYGLRRIMRSRTKWTFHKYLGN